MTKQEAIQYKTLTYSGFFVDYSLLEKGIYASTKPCIFQLNESIESLIKYYRIILK